MIAILLNGSVAGYHTGERVSAELAAQLQAQGGDVAHILPRQKKINLAAEALAQGHSSPLATRMAWLSLSSFTGCTN